MPLGHPDAADVNRDRTVDSGRSDHELGGAAADVDDEVRRLGRQPAHRTGERQPGLIVSGYHLGRDAQRGEHHRSELVRVARVAGRGRGAHADPLGAQLRDLRGVAGEHDAGALDRLRREPAGTVDALAEPHDLHPPGHVREGRTGRGWLGRAGRGRIREVGHEEPDGVGSTVDRRHPRHAANPTDRY
jgi:hypothetical protein